MALYLGSEKVQVYLDNVKYNLQLYIETLMTNGVTLLSSDNYILKDANGAYLTAKEDEE